MVHKCRQDRLVIHTRMLRIGERPNGRQERDVRMWRDRPGKGCTLGCLSLEELHDVCAHALYLACLWPGRGRRGGCASRCRASGARTGELDGGAVALGRQGEEGRKLAINEVEVLEDLLCLNVAPSIRSTAYGEREIG